MTTGNTMVLSSHLTVNLAFPASMAETIPSLDTEATAGRSEVYEVRVERVTSILEPSEERTISGSICRERYITYAIHFCTWTHNIEPTCTVAIYSSESVD
jgi:hypothetical protein